MPSNLLAPRGLAFASNSLAAANNYAQFPYNIHRGYASNIAIGDLVRTGTGSDQGYVVLSGRDDTGALGVFGGVLPYYDQTFQAIAHGINGQYTTTANPPSGVDVPCLVASDPFSTFIAQVSGGVWANSWRGQNINFTTGSNGNPNSAGQSVLSLDYATLGGSSSLPFRIVQAVGVTGGPQDPANTNPWVLVRLNTNEQLNTTGI